MNAKSVRRTIFSLLIAAALLAGGSAIMAQADPAGTQALAMTRDVTTYTLKAQPIDLEGMPGVYRVDVSQIIEDAKAKAKGGKLDGKYLHVKQESNIALMASYGIERRSPGGR